jgi:aspartate aminotransferase
MLIERIIMPSIRLSERVTSIKESPSAVAADHVRDLRAQGRNILSLTVGQPDFDTPESICEAAVEAIKHGETRYTSANGTPELRNAIKQYYLRRYGRPCEDDEICVGVGGKQVIALALMATLCPGDEVIVPAPYWVSYTDMAIMNSGTPVVVETTETDGFKMTPEELEQAISDSTRWLILNSPSNPSGAVYSTSELQALADVLRKHSDVLVLCDDIYNEIVFSDAKPEGLVSIAPDLADRILTVNGVSKTYAMTGWRIGFGIGPKALIGAMNKLVSQISSCASSVSQAAAAAALTGDQSAVGKMVQAYHERRDFAVERINQIDGLSCLSPDGAFYIYVNCAGLIGRHCPDGTVLSDDAAVSDYFLSQASVGTVPGTAYGLSPYFRISFATSIQVLGDAFDSIEQAISVLQ